MYAQIRLTTLVAVIAFATLAQPRAHANCYPSGLKVSATVITSCQAPTVRYVLNENADNTPGVTIKVRKVSDDSIVRTVTFTNPAPETRKGVHTFSWDKKDDSNVPAPDLTAYYFEITTSDNGYGTWTRIDTDTTLNTFELPRGVAVNKNNTPGNEYFGRVYVSQARDCTAGGGAGRDLDNGIYILNPDWSDADILGGTGPKTGGVTWTADDNACGTLGGTGPFRVQVGPDNQVYITDFSDVHSGLWVADPDITSATEVIDSTAGRDVAGLVTGLHGSIPDVYIEGTGASRKIYTNDEDYPSSASGQRGSVLRYDIGAAASTSTLSAVFYDDAATYAGQTNRIINFTDSFDFGNGNFWITQNRAGGTAEIKEASLIKLDTSGNILYASVPDTYANSNVDGFKQTQGMAYGEDTGAGGTHKYLALATNRANGVVLIVDPTTNPPSLTPTPHYTSFTFGTNNGTNCDCVFDAAGNLYVTNRTGERVRTWSPPTGANTFTTKSGSFTLNGVGAGGPTINPQPISQSVCINTNVQFTVNSGPYTYQWFKDGNPLSNGGHYSGVSTNQLTVTGADLTDVGSYRVSVCDVNGVTLSDPATLLIYAAPTITKDPCPRTVVAGGTTSFTVTATSAVTPTPTLSYQWRKKIGVNPPVNIGIDSSTLTLTHASYSDNGALIDVVVTDTCGRTTTSGLALLTVIPQPCHDPFADADGNGVIDLRDFAAFQACYTGPAGVDFDLGLCSCFDRNADGDVDDGDDGGGDTSDFLAYTACAGAAGSHPFPAIAGCDGIATPPLFADNFDTNTAANWTLVNFDADVAVTFAYDYSADGIPAAPGGATTLGLKMEVNQVLPAAVASLTLSPNGQNFTATSYTLEFDMWINANGPFPAGGVGSTEYVTAGIGYTGPTVNNAAAPVTGSGAWFAVDGEGQSGGRDFRAFKNAGEQFAESTQFAAPGNSAASPLSGNAHNSSNAYYSCTFPGGQMAPLLQQTNFVQQTGGMAVGSVGFAWRHVKISVFPSGAGVAAEWSIDGLRIATLRTNVGVVFPITGNIAIGYMDVATSVSDNAALSFALIDNVKVTQN